MGEMRTLFRFYSAMEKTFTTKYVDDDTEQKQHVRKGDTSNASNHPRRAGFCMEAIFPSFILPLKSLIIKLRPVLG